MSDHVLEPEKLDLATPDIAEERRAELLRLFPEVRTEGGKVDFERLKAVLGEMVDSGRERYGMNWPGKAECMRTIQAPSMGTLLPMPDESVNWDTTENVIIEGDNLEVLKLLQKSYLGKIKMIYIDPPYNTGRDFVYPDDYAESLQTYLEYTGQADDTGRRFSSNSDSTGRFHSKWLNMMYPRLYLARQLLKENGVAFISIGESELANLVELCDIVFGEENRLGIACRVAKKSNNKGDYWAPNFDYVLTYARNIDLAEPFFGGVNEGAYDQVETDGPRKGERYQLVRLYMSTIQNRNPEQRFWIECPDGSKVIPPGSTLPPTRPELGDGIWRWTRTKFEAERDKIVIKEVRSSNLISDSGQPAKWNVFTKTYLNDVIANASAKPNNLIEDFINQEGSHELGKLDIPFDYPKPSGLIKFLADISKVGEGDIVLDFFAGSGSTAQAILDANASDGQNRKFVLVQLQEPCEEASEEFKAGFRTISDITKERVRRVIAQLEKKTTAGLFDTGSRPGFRVLKLQASNFIPWDGTASNDADQLAKQLTLGIDHTRGDRTPQDLLFEVLLKSWGEPALSLRVGEETIEGVRVFSIADGAFLICLEEKVNLEFIRALAAKKPDRVVMRESAFTGNDQLKTNAVQTFKSQGVTSFKVV